MESPDRQAGARPGAFAFPKHVRLRRKADYDRVFREGIHVRNRLFLLVCAANGLDHPRMGLAVGRRYGKAVARNRLKRLCREAFRLHRSALPPGIDFVVLPKSGPEAYTLEEVARSFGRLLSEARTRLGT